MGRQCSKQEEKFSDWSKRMLEEPVSEWKENEYNAIQKILKIYYEQVVLFDEDKYSEKTIIESKEFENPL